MGWIIPTPLADCAVDLLRTHFPVVHDSRPNAPPPPLFVDGPAADPLARLDLVPILRPAAPALRALHYERHPARATFTQIADYDPGLLAGLGLAESLDERWVIAYAAERFWQELLRNLEAVVTANVQADGSLCEQLAADDLRTFWLATRERCGGPPPEYRGERWYPAQSTLPLWVAALLACLDDPPFVQHHQDACLARTLPAWPLRRSPELHRLDLKEAAHWPLSVCVLPARQSPDVNDILLHLSSVNGVSKNRALWAAVLDGRREQIPLRAGDRRHYARRAEGRNQYVTDWNDEPLASSGLSHLVLTHRSAFEPELGQAFLHLAGNDLTGAPDLPLFAQQFSRAISLPFDLAWAPELWRYAIADAADELPLITPLLSSGCQGYWVRADEARWTRLIIAIQRGLTPDQLSDADLAITEIGATSAIAEVMEQGNEDDLDNEA